MRRAAGDAPEEALPISGKPPSVVARRNCTVAEKVKLSGVPETMAVREKLLPESGVISQLVMSAMDDWGKEIKEQAAAALVIIEGLTMYLSEAEVQRIFAVISQRFEEAAVFAETMNPMVVARFKEKSIEGSRAKFTWGVKSGEALAELLPGFRFFSESINRQVERRKSPEPSVPSPTFFQ